MKNEGKSRIERDTMGDIEVADERLWGAQTQRSLHHFRIALGRLRRKHETIDAEGGPRKLQLKLATPNRSRP